MILSHELCRLEYASSLKLSSNIYSIDLNRLPHNDYLLYSSLIPKRVIDADPRMKFIAKSVQLVDDGR